MEYKIVRGYYIYEDGTAKNKFANPIGHLDKRGNVIFDIENTMYPASVVVACAWYNDSILPNKAEKEKFYVGFKDGNTYNVHRDNLVLYKNKKDYHDALDNLEIFDETDPKKIEEQFKASTEAFYKIIPDTGFHKEIKPKLPKGGFKCKAEDICDEIYLVDVFNQTYTIGSSREMALKLGIDRLRVIEIARNCGSINHGKFYLTKYFGDVWGLM